MAPTTKRWAAPACSRIDARGAALAGGAAVVLAAAAAVLGDSARAFPDGVPWDTAGSPEGCVSCHFDSPDPEASPHLTLSGLPERVAPGRAYELTLRLDDDALLLAGFLLTVMSGGEAAGRLAATDASAEALGAQARSTRAGAAPPAPGRADWRLLWTAPSVLAEPVRFDVWANAANDDQSPFGDRTHHRRWERPPANAGEASGAAR